MKEKRHGSALCRPRRTSRALSTLYQSLLTYGRQIFQLCVGTLLFGDYLARQAGLPDILVTNQERFESVCKILDDENLPITDRFAAVDATLALVSEFRYVQETGLSVATMIGAVKRSANKLLLCDHSFYPSFEQLIKDLATAKASPDCYEGLAALHALNERKTVATEYRSPRNITLRMAEVVWHYTFMHYFWLKEQRARAANDKETP